MFHQYQAPKGEHQQIAFSETFDLYAMNSFFPTFLAKVNNHDEGYHTVPPHILRNCWNVEDQDVNDAASVYFFLYFEGKNPSDYRVAFEGDLDRPYLDEEGFLIEEPLFFGLNCAVALFQEPEGKIYSYAASQLGSRGNKSQREDRLVAVIFEFEEEA